MTATNANRRSDVIRQLLSEIGIADICRSCFH